MNNLLDFEYLKKLKEDLEKIMIREHLLIGVEFGVKYFWQKGTRSIVEQDRTKQVEQEVFELVKQSIQTMFKSK